MKYKTPTLGAALRRIRRYHKVTGKDMAARIGCHASMVSRYERGRYCPSQRVLNEYAALSRVK